MNLLYRMKTVPVPGCLAPPSPLRRLGEAAARHGWLTFPLLFAVFVSVLCPWWSVYEFDVDEGFNMAKAVLVANGFRLYADVWSDQPPLLTWLLAARELFDPWNIAQARGSFSSFHASSWGPCSASSTGSKARGPHGWPCWPWPARRSTNGSPSAS